VNSARPHPSRSVGSDAPRSYQRCHADGYTLSVVWAIGDVQRVNVTDTRYVVEVPLREAAREEPGKHLGRSEYSTIPAWRAAPTRGLCVTSNACRALRPTSRRRRR
jgi:hypothetical protein